MKVEKKKDWHPPWPRSLGRRSSAHDGKTLLRREDRQRSPEARNDRWHVYTFASTDQVFNGLYCRCRNTVYEQRRGRPEFFLRSVLCSRYWRGCGRRWVRNMFVESRDVEKSNRNPSAPRASSFGEAKECKTSIGKIGHRGEKNSSDRGK